MKLHHIIQIFIVLCILHSSFGVESHRKHYVAGLSNIFQHVINPTKILHRSRAHLTKRTGTGFEPVRSSSSFRDINTDCDVRFTPGAIEELEEGETENILMALECPPGADFQVSTRKVEMLISSMIKILGVLEFDLRSFVCVVRPVTVSTIITSIGRFNPDIS